MCDLKFSPCGRYLFWVSKSVPVKVCQFDVWERRVVRRFTVHENSDVDYAGLSFHSEALYVVLVIEFLIVLVRVPISSEPEYLTRIAFAGPHLLKNANDVRILWPRNSSEELVAVVRCLNQLRQNGSESSRVQAPIVLSAHPDKLPPWTAVPVEGLVEYVDRRGAKSRTRDSVNKDSELVVSEEQCKSLIEFTEDIEETKIPFIPGSWVSGEEIGSKIYGTLIWCPLVIVLIIYLFAC